VHIVRTRRYRWPVLQLNFWFFIMLVAASVQVGIFASFITVQAQLQLGVPWYVLCSPNILLDRTSGEAGNLRTQG
jgi:hypothetical protein